MIHVVALNSTHFFDVYSKSNPGDPWIPEGKKRKWNRASLRVEIRKSLDRLYFVRFDYVMSAINNQSDEDPCTHSAD